MYRIGIDLGGTNIALGIVDGEKIIYRKSVRTNLPKTPKELVFDIKALVDDSLCEFGIKISDLEKIGIGIPGSVDERTGYLEFANNFGYEHVPLISMLRETFEVPLFAGNDANVAALAEYYFGAGKGSRSMVMFTLGTGLGGAYIEEGRMLLGISGAGAELGHEVIVAGGRECNCGRRGCLETYASATALVSDAINKEFKSEKLRLACENPKFGAKELIELAKEGDESALEVWNNYIDMLSVGVANNINVFLPEKFVIGGGVSGAGDFLIDALKNRVEGEVYARGLKKKTDIVIAKLGNDAGILGASMLK